MSINPKLVAFMTEFADLLEKHDAEIDIDQQYLQGTPHVVIWAGYEHDDRLYLESIRSDNIRRVIQPHLEGGE